MRYAVERQALLTSLDMSRNQQLQFKNQFLSHVSHELRTPLTCIHQFVSLMLDGLAGRVNTNSESIWRRLSQRESATAMIRDCWKRPARSRARSPLSPTVS